MIRYTLPLTFILFIAFFKVQSQNTATGEWREHYTFNLPSEVVCANDKAIVLSDLASYIYDFETGSTQLHTKKTGAGDVMPIAADYDNSTGVIVVGYRSGAIDLIKSTETFTEYALVLKSELKSKSINDVVCFDSYAYLATDYGISIYDLTNYEFVDSYFLGEDFTSLKINNISVSDGMLYAMSEKQIYKASVINQAKPTLSNFDIVEHFYDDSTSFKQVEYFASNLFLLYEKNGVKKLDVLTDSVFEPFKTEYGSLQELRKRNDHLVVIANKKVDVFDSDLVLKQRVDASDYNNVGLKTADLDANNELWIGAPFYGLLNNGKIYYSPKSTLESYCSDIVYGNGNIYLTQGRIWSYDQGTAFIYKEDDRETKVNWGVFDYMTIAPDPNDEDHFYIGTHLDGVLEYKDGDVVNHYNQESGITLSQMSDNYYAVSISRLRFDSEGKLWALSNYSKTPLHVLDGDEWISYEKGSNGTVRRFEEFFICSNDYKWYTERSAGGKRFYVFTESGTYDDKSDDIGKVLYVKDETGSTFANIVFDIDQDHNGDIWIGTDNGIAVMRNPENVFDENLHFSQLVVEKDGFHEHLLSSIRVTSIVVDGGDRKWIGTEGAGLFLLSAGGTRQLLHFTKENSPLPDNNIEDLEINDKTGELFVSTRKGLLSYRADATEPVERVGEVTVFPNPVTPGYNGAVYINGLPENASLKITDVSGTIVNDAVVNGGMAVWDLTNVYGQKVETGVYLLLCTDELGEQTFVSKVAVVKGE